MKKFKEVAGEVVLLFIVALCLIVFIGTVSFFPLANKGLTQGILAFGAVAAVLNSIVEFKNTTNHKKLKPTHNTIEIIGIITFIALSVLIHFILRQSMQLMDYWGLFCIICILECSMYHLYNDPAFNTTRKQI